MRGYCGIGLFNPKTDANVGSALRACACYGAGFMAVSGHRYKKAGTDTTKQWRHMPFLAVNNLRDIIPYGCVPIAVDLLDGAVSIVNFVHPERAFYIFGPEDGTLGKQVTDWCPIKLYVPTKYCMNLASCVNVVLYDRMAKLYK